MYRRTDVIYCRSGTKYQKCDDWTIGSIDRDGDPVLPSVNRDDDTGLNYCLSI